MGKCVVHMQKVKAGGVGGIQIHMKRELPSKSNPDIDAARTPQNYDLMHNASSYRQYINDAISVLAPDTKTVRKDAVVLCSFIITSDEATMKDMTPEQLQSFFKASVNWFADRYGVEQLVYATVHMDETTPHLHLGIVPIKDGRLTAKDLFNPKELRAIQTEFAADVGRLYGLERGKEGSERKHLSEVKYKAAMLSKEVQELQDKVDELKAEVDLAERCLKEKGEQGAAAFGTAAGYRDRMAQIKAADRRDRLLDRLQSFVALPQIQPLWDAFQAAQSRSRNVKRERGT